MTSLTSGDIEILLDPAEKLGASPHDNVSENLEHIFMRLGSLEHSLKHRHLTITADEEFAHMIAKRVVEQLSGGIGASGGPDSSSDCYGLGSIICATPNASIGSGAVPDETTRSPRPPVLRVGQMKRAREPNGDNGPAINEPEGNNEDDGAKAVTLVSSMKTNAAEDVQELSYSRGDNGPVKDSSYHSSFSGGISAIEQSLESDIDAGKQEKLNRLRKSMEFVEDYKAAIDADNRSMKEKICQADARTQDTLLDLVVATIIVLNAAVIGISMDYKLAVWEVIDVCFTVCFLIELFFKLRLHGCKEHFSTIPNCLDFCLVALDVTQLVMTKFLGTDLLEDAPSASIFRVVRLARLARLIRLARLNVFDDLVAMITGLVGGMTTLTWSIVFFALIVYITSLLFREFYGNRSITYEGVNIRRYFDSVPRSMLTVFRYFFGDFSTASGINLFEAIQDEYGTIHGLFVAMLFFVITIGLFNVIAAIFVESTLSAAFALQNSRKRERMKDDLLWGTRITTLVRKFYEYNGAELTEPLSKCVDKFADTPFYEDTFKEFIKDPEVIHALNDLEISEEDHKYLFDILDNDNTGDILVSQLSDGVERLRGDPRRSDIICIDLMVRSIQEQANFLVKAAKRNMETTAVIRKAVMRTDAKMYDTRTSPTKRPSDAMLVMDEVCGI